jgi:acetyl-CoA carboxylase biotin carboxyl carrier protein
MTEPMKPDDVFDIDRIRKLIELMKEHELGEIDLRQDSQRIRLCGAGQGQPIVTAFPQMQPAPVAPTAATPAVSPATAAPTDADGPHIAIIKSPMVGTFYSRANPTAKNFVEVGSSVQAESVVCFNEIPAEMRGKIVQVLVKNEEAVDFGKPLFKIDTRG